MNEHDNAELIELLVEEMLNPNEGERCAICLMTDETECIWQEVGQHLVQLGEEVKSDKLKGSDDVAAAEKAARYTMYRYYTFTVSNWAPGMGRIRCPICVEEQIRLHFPGDGQFVGFKKERKPKN